MEPDRRRPRKADDEEDHAWSLLSTSSSTNKSNSGTVHPHQSVLAAEVQDRRIRQLETELAAANNKNNARLLVQQKDDQLAEQSASFMSTLEFLLCAFNVHDQEEGLSRDEIRSSLLLAGGDSGGDDDGGKDLEKAVTTLQLVMYGLDQRILVRDCS
jgi:hypothetical protein